jgi:hypothetical protein
MANKGVTWVVSCSGAMRHGFPDRDGERGCYHLHGSYHPAG